MQPAERTQTDGFGDHYSEATAIHFNPDDDMCRQEFRDECDINVILSRVGAGDLRPVRFGEAIDADYDLLLAFDAIRNAEASYAELPQDLRSRYKDVSALVDALDRGELTLTSEPPPTPAPAAPASQNPAGSAGVPPAENAG